MQRAMAALMKLSHVWDAPVRGQSSAKLLLLALRAGALRLEGIRRIRLGRRGRPAGFHGGLGPRRRSPDESSQPMSRGPARIRRAKRSAAAPPATSHRHVAPSVELKTPVRAMIIVPMPIEAT